MFQVRFVLDAGRVSMYCLRCLLVGLRDNRGWLARVGLSRRWRVEL